MTDDDRIPAPELIVLSPFTFRYARPLSALRAPSQVMLSCKVERPEERCGDSKG